uniref:Putative secreted protein n=1 Tax=Ixodes scapularis TaxID=6945 RepID=A0A4D5RAN7_IXOSC
MGRWTRKPLAPGWLALTTTRVWCVSGRWRQGGGGGGGGSWRGSGGGGGGGSFVSGANSISLGSRDNHQSNGNGYGNTHNYYSV